MISNEVSVKYLYVQNANLTDHFDNLFKVACPPKNKDCLIFRQDITADALFSLYFR